MHSIKGVVDSDGKPPQIFESMSESELNMRDMDELRSMHKQEGGDGANAKADATTESDANADEAKKTKKPALKLKLGEMKQNKAA